MRTRGSILLAAALLLGLARPSLMEGSVGEYRLEIQVSSQDLLRPFEWEALLDRREFRRVEFNPRKQLKAYFLEAHMALARKLGYHEKIYGKEFYKYVKVEMMLYEIYDVHSRRVVLQGRKR